MMIQFLSLLIEHVRSLQPTVRRDRTCFKAGVETTTPQSYNHFCQRTEFSLKTFFVRLGCTYNRVPCRFSGSSSLGKLRKK